MTELAQPYLAPWTTYFTMTATAAATLIGLMFVVVTLITRDQQRSGDAGVGLSTFSTPTVIHFGAALLLSMILVAPWPRMAGPLVLITLMGVAEVVHMVRVARRTRELRVYEPDAEDLAWYSVIPFITYGALLISGVSLAFAPQAALWILCAVVSLLIFIGIRNAWDVVTYLAIGQAQGGSEED